MDGVYEIAVHFNEFTNVDLFRQGLYYLRVFVFIEDDFEGKGEIKKRFALPYRLILPKSSQCDTGLLRPSQRESLPAQIDQKIDAFCSRAFRVQYQEQTILLNEICVFRLELCPHLDASVEIQIELMFHELHVDEWRKQESLPDANLFEVLDTASLMIRDVKQNVHSMIPITFDQNNFCLLKTCAHMSLVNFRFIPSPVIQPSGDAPHKQTLQQSLFPQNGTETPTPEQWQHCQDHLTYYLQCGIKSYTHLRNNVNTYFYDHVPENDHESLFAILPSEIPIGTINLPVELLQDPDLDLEELDHRNIPRFLKPLDERFENSNEVKGCELISIIQNDFNFLAAQLFEVWHSFLTLLPYCTQNLIIDLNEEWETNLVERWGLSIFRENCKISERNCMNEKSRDEHEMISRAIRQQNAHLSSITGPNLCLKQLLEPAKFQCVLFEQTYNTRDDVKRTPRMRFIEEEHTAKKTKKRHRNYRPGKHLFVFCHGYQGNSWDMRMFKNHLACTYPSALFCLSKANEGKTDGFIKEMGERLAEEVVEFIDENCSVHPEKISFVCHSLGGIIARQCLTEPIFAEYLGSLFTFISLAVCHCGYLFGKSKLMAGGLFIVRKWTKSKCLTQLSLSEVDDPRDTYIYQLSQKSGLEHFKNVLLISSPEDRYTPYHSARIEMHEKVLRDNYWGPVYQEMVDNLLNPLEGVNLMRFDVSFAQKGSSLDTMIGRASHIFFLDQALYINMLISVYKKFFSGDPPEIGEDEEEITFSLTNSTSFK